MPAIHLVTENDTDFPYDAVREAILGLDGIVQDEIDFGSRIEMARVNQWPEQIIQSYEAQRDSGKCFAFNQKVEPFLKGEMYDTNVRFVFDDDAHQEACTSLVEDLTGRNGLKMTMAL